MNHIYAAYPMVKLVSYLIGLHDVYGVEHGERVAKICLELGKVYGISGQDLEILELSGLIHDIGKLTLPDSIRAKPGKLTEAELLMMRQHPVFGLNILQRMNGSISPRVHQAVLHHHEDFGGTGYPNGLKGEDIPIEARIIRIADTFDALTHLRGYRPPLSKSDAIDLMLEDQEKHQLYDPKLLRLFLELQII